MGQLGSVVDLPFNLRTLVEAGVVKPMAPTTLLKVGKALRTWGASPAAGIASSAIQRPDTVALIDDAGELTFAELDSRSNSLARALREEGVKAGESVAIMCRNHRGFVDALFACSKLGATVLLMNTDFAGPQLHGVIEREQPQAIIYDSEFQKLLDGAEEEDPQISRFVSWVDDGDEVSETSTEDAIASTSDDPLDPPDETSRFIVLTSGTTGTPKGAQRNSPDSLAPLAIMLSRIPLKSERTTVIAPPMFHSWGFLHFTLGLALGSTYVMRRRFDPEGTLKAVQENGADALVVVPVMLQRIMELDKEVRDKYPLDSLRIVAASGSALPGELAIRWMDQFGDNVYNLYGSTEVAWASIATPEDIRDAPGTAGKVPHGTIVKLLDDHGTEVPHGETGRIFVGNEMSFEGYTGGGGKDIIDGLLSSGDVGHFDEKGRLFIDGRDDEMIVSGGENVFPREVEDVLSDHESIHEAAVIGVDDEKFGQRLKAFVVTSSGKELDEDAVKAHVKDNLARYKVPREVEFMDELPRNPTGKILKRELAGADEGGGSEGGDADGDEGADESSDD
ncbi:MAG: acyl-CoA synthetase [Solirubrobacterales bacterium]|nr:acyl-CoA synthetase [Solirubrobacterales bacterium]